MRFAADLCCLNLKSDTVCTDISAASFCGDSPQDLRANFNDGTCCSCNFGLMYDSVGKDCIAAPPSAVPTAAPTAQPTKAPSAAPTAQPTLAPTVPTHSPTPSPTLAPTSWPTDPFTNLTAPETAEKAEQERLARLRAEQAEQGGGLSGVWVAFVVIVTLCFGALAAAVFISQRQLPATGSDQQQQGFSFTNPLPTEGPPGSEVL